MPLNRFECGLERKITGGVGGGQVRRSKVREWKGHEGDGTRTEKGRKGIEWGMMRWCWRDGESDEKNRERRNEGKGKK